MYDMNFYTSYVWREMARSEKEENSGSVPPVNKTSRTGLGWIYLQMANILLPTQAMLLVVRDFYLCLKAIC